MKINIKKILREYSDDELYDYKPNFTAKELLDFIKSEWDVEMLELISGEIENRINFLRHLDYMANRKEIRGFKKD